MFEEAVKNYQKLNEFIENIHELRSVTLLTCEPIMRLKRAVEYWNEQWKLEGLKELNELLKPENIILPQIQPQVLRIKVIVRKE